MHLPQLNLIDLTPVYGTLRVTGSDATRFLQGQLTCDMYTFIPHQQQLGALCNLQGRVIALFHITQNAEGYLLRLPLNLLNKAFDELHPYSLFSQITLEICSAPQWHRIGILPEGQPRFEIFYPTTLHQKILEYLAPIAWLPFHYWQVENIRHGLPEIQAHTSERFLPHDLNLPALKGVSFTKGCYRGQEIVSRMEYRGHVKHHLKHFFLPLDAPIPEGDVISACITPQQEQALLMRVKI